MTGWRSSAPLRADTVVSVTLEAVDVHALSGWMLAF
jgi:hypothetical protein